MKYSSKKTVDTARREFLKQTGMGGLALAAATYLPAWARSGRANNTVGIAALSGPVFDLEISQMQHRVAGKSARTVLVNRQLPAPLLRWREGEDITLRVTNHLQETTSIHWHGILLPFQMDGVPGVTFPGIQPGETFVYKFPLKQGGTYWYHSHSGFQEQLGHYGPIVIEPLADEPYQYDRDYVVVLSDWTFEDPQRVFAKLKKMSDTYNYQQRTVFDFFEDVHDAGFDAALWQRMMWGDMRMNPTDIADVTAATYTYLVNGHSPRENWTGLFQPGEQVRLRFINAAAMSIFNVRIPGLPMTVIQADGLDVQPVATDEFQIGVAETFDVIVTPDANQAYTIMCESNDRSGYGRATLAPREGMHAVVPALRARPTLTMKDMAMSHMSHGDHAMHTEHGSMHEMHNTKSQSHEHKTGPGVVGLAEQPTDRLAERPLGLEDVPHRVLVYSDLKSLQPNPDPRPPGREIELHLTSNMERYMWSFDGVKFSEVDGPILFKKDERLCLTMVNDTMMPHPIHLHGMFFEVVTGEHNHRPMKHTIVIKPGERLSLYITADAEGEWAFHCHLLYHMMAGMMRVVSVRA